jgi:hypothetical protein
LLLVKLITVLLPINDLRITKRLVVIAFLVTVVTVEVAGAMVFATTAEFFDFVMVIYLKGYEV